MSITLPKFRNVNNNLLFISAFIIVTLFLFAIFRDNSKLITLNEAKELLDSQSISKVVLTSDFTYLYSLESKYRIPTSQVTPKLLENQRVEFENSSNLFFNALVILFFIALLSFIVKFYKKKTLFSFAKGSETLQEKSSVTPSSHIAPVKSDVNFDDIGGITEVKIELEEIIDFLKNPKRYKDFGARLPKGVLLVGPPGVGKTMIAKAVAAEANVPFFYQSGASFVQIYIGMGAKRVHDLFSAAQKAQPAIIFIDEIDAIGKKRDGQKSDEREATLNQLLTEMDGFGNSSGIIVIAATNKIDVLDEALLRAGRFDRRIHVELPTQLEREIILGKYLSKIPHNIDSHEIAQMSLGFNGAALATLVNEAALLALRSNDDSVTIEHFNAVKNKVQHGKKRVQVLTQNQRECRAIYQSAKALYATWNDLDFDKVHLTADNLPPSLGNATLKSELLIYVKLHLSGITLCKIRLSEHDIYAKEDIKTVKNLVHLMLHKYAMGDKFFSDELELNKFITKEEEEIKDFLLSKDAILNPIIDELLSKELITKERVKVIINGHLE